MKTIKSINICSDHNSEWTVEPVFDKDVPNDMEFYKYTENFEEFLKSYLDFLSDYDIVNVKFYSDYVAQPIKELAELARSVKGYFTGFATSPFFIYKFKSYPTNNGLSFDTKEALIKHCSQLSNCVFYGVTYSQKTNEYIIRYTEVEPTKK